MRSGQRSSPYIVIIPTPRWVIRPGARGVVLLLDDNDSGSNSGYGPKDIDGVRADQDNKVVIIKVLA